MRNEKIESKTKSIPTRSTYETDSFRKITDPETGEVEVKRWVETRQVNANLSTHEGSVFHNGARIA